MSTPIKNKKKFVDEARRLGTTLLSDGMSRIGLRNCCMDYNMRPVKRASAAGTAFTVCPFLGDNSSIHMACLENGKGFVMIVAGQGYEKAAYIGELVCRTAQAKHFEAVILDGLARDKEKLEKMSIPVFCKGFIPAGPSKSIPGDINVPVECAGVHVEPGDLVVCDVNGIAVIPRDHIETVLSFAKQKKQYEQDRIKILKEYEKAETNGCPLPNITPAWLKKERQDND